MSLRPRDRLYIFLHHISGDISQWFGVWQFKMCAPCHNQSIEESIETLFEHLVPEMIQLPTKEEAQMEIDLFHHRSAFPPDVWACIDGTHIEVSSIYIVQYRM